MPQINTYLNIMSNGYDLCNEILQQLSNRPKHHPIHTYWKVKSDYTNSCKYNPRAAQYLITFEMAEYEKIGYFQIFQTHDFLDFKFKPRTYISKKKRKFVTMLMFYFSDYLLTYYSAYLERLVILYL